MLRARGAGPVPPKPSRPSFARASRRGPVPSSVLAGLAGAAAIAGGAVAGLFFVPLIVGLLGGVVAACCAWLGGTLGARAAGRVPAQLSDTPIHRSDETEALVRILGGTRARENPIGEG